MSVTVRAVTPEDRADWGTLWGKYLSFYETSRPDDVYEETWRRIMAGENEMYSAIAVDETGRAVGITNFLYHGFFWGPEPRIYLNDLFVDPDIRGTGAGRALIEYVEEHAQAHGAASIYWLTAEDNVAARHLYDRIAKKSVFVHYTMPL